MTHLPHAGTRAASVDVIVHSARRKSGDTAAGGVEIIGVAGEAYGSTFTGGRPSPMKRNWTLNPHCSGRRATWRVAQ